MRSCVKQLLQWPKNGAEPPGRLCQECDPRKSWEFLAVMRQHIYKEKFPKMTWKLQWGKAAGAAALPSPSAFPAASWVYHPMWILIFYFYFFLLFPLSHPSQAAFPQNSEFPKQNLEILGSSLERSSSPEIAFFGPAQSNKSSQRIKCTNFQQLNLAFLHRGTRGKGKQLNCKFLVLIHEFSIRIPACKCCSLSPKSTFLVGIKLANLNQPKCCYLYIAIKTSQSRLQTCKPQKK